MKSSVFFFVVGLSFLIAGQFAAILENASDAPRIGWILVNTAQMIVGAILLRSR